MSTTVSRPQIERFEADQAAQRNEDRATFYRRLQVNQERARQLVRPGVSVVDEFILEKRAETRREELDWTKDF